MERNTRIEEELFPFYALDALTDEEREEVERYVTANPAAGARLAEMSLAVAEFGAAATPITPTPAIKAGLMARVEADLRADAPAVVAPPTVERAAPRRAPSAPTRKPPAEARRPWWQSFTPALGAFAALALIVAAVAVWQLLGQVGALEERVAQLEANTGSMQAQIGALEEENSALRQEITVRDDLLAQFTAPGAITLALGDISGEHPDAVGALTLNPDSDAATLSVANMPLLDETQTYQAWLIVGETPISAGTFTVDDNGTGTHVLSGDIPVEFDAVGVSMEPTGGSETPTPGNIILLGRSF